MLSRVSGGPFSWVLKDPAENWRRAGRLPLRNPGFSTNQSGMIGGLFVDHDSGFGCRPVGSVWVGHFRSAPTGEPRRAHFDQTSRVPFPGDSSSTRVLPQSTIAGRRTVPTVRHFAASAVLRSRFSTGRTRPSPVTADSPLRSRGNWKIKNPFLTSVRWMCRAALRKRIDLSLASTSI
jgi:hypothetical protein